MNQVLMKAAFQTSIIITFAVFSVQCSSNTGKIHWQTNVANPPANNSTSANTQSRSDDLMSKEELQSLYELAQNAVKRESLKLKIKSLKDAAPHSGTETRVWVGFGLSYPRCFILENLDGKQKAFYIAPKIIGNKAVIDAKGEALMTKTVLGAAKSGWGEFDRFLKENGIDSTLKFSLDKKNMAVPDGEAIVVEVRSSATYNMVYYSLYTESVDGQKALKVCRRIEQEFNIRMGCVVSDASVK